MAEGNSPDIQKILAPVVEAGDAPDSHQISRRRFLKTAAIAGTVGALGYTAIRSHYFGLFDTRRGETPHEKKLENEFNVEILSANQAYDVLNKTPFQKPSQDVLFTDGQLGMLGEMLPFLPSNLYRPHKERRLSIAPVGLDMMRKTGMQRGGYKLATKLLNPDGQPLMMLVDSFFQPERKGYAFRVLAHELAHRRDYEMTDNHELWDEVNEILRYETFADFKDAILPVLDEIPPENPEMESVRNWMGYALKGADGKGKNEPDELIGVLAGTYVGGHQDFDYLTPYLGKATSDRLYGFMRDRIFEGREYNGDQRPKFLDSSSYKD